MESRTALGFPHPGKPCEYFVVGMTRMQYGEAGRGIQGKCYFLGALNDFVHSMEKICAEIVWQPTLPPSPFLGMKGQHENRLIAYAKKAWVRWQNRGREG
jgi:hypothetical protein